VDAKSYEIPAVRNLLKAFTSLAAAVITIDAIHTHSDTAHTKLPASGEPRINDFGGSLSR
jgi:hypothetical protein